MPRRPGARSASGEGRVRSLKRPAPCHLGNGRIQIRTCRHAIVGAMSLDPRVDIGHVHLKVADIDRSLGFYRDVLGFDVMQRLGDEAAFISAGGYHHHLGLNTWDSRGGSPPPQNTTGLYHVAIRYPDRAQLGNALKRLVDANWPISGATDHGVSEAIYLRDPDGNGIELYRDRPEPEWPRAEDGGLSMISDPLDLQALLMEAA